MSMMWQDFSGQKEAVHPPEHSGNNFNAAETQHHAHPTWNIILCPAPGLCAALIGFK